MKANEGMRKENTKIKEELAKVRVEIEQDQSEHKIEMKQIKVEREQFMNENHSERRIKNLAENNHQQAKEEIVDLTKRLSDMKQQLNEGSENIYQLKLQLQGLSGPTGEWQGYKQPSPTNKPARWRTKRSDMFLQSII